MSGTGGKVSPGECTRSISHIKEEDAKEEMERLGLLNVKEA